MDKKEFLTEKDIDGFILKFLEEDKNKSIITKRPSLYEMSFLSSMIKGRYKNKSVESFESNKDKRLFDKYASLSKEEQEKQYKELQIKLNKSIRK